MVEKLGTNFSTMFRLTAGLTVQKTELLVQQKQIMSSASV